MNYPVWDWKKGSPDYSKCKVQRREKGSRQFIVLTPDGFEAGLFNNKAEAEAALQGPNTK
jgi:hypothetical protein